jgi:hypothetical protein
MVRPEMTETGSAALPQPLALALHGGEEVFVWGRCSSAKQTGTLALTSDRVLFVPDVGPDAVEIGHASEGESGVAPDGTVHFLRPGVDLMCRGLDPDVANEIVGTVAFDVAENLYAGNAPMLERLTARRWKIHERLQAPPTEPASHGRAPQQSVSAPQSAIGTTASATSAPAAQLSTGESIRAQVMRASLIGAIVAFVAFIVGIATKSGAIDAIGFLAWLGLMLVYLLANPNSSNRCPHCGKKGAKISRAPICSHCGRDRRYAAAKH